MAESRDLPPGLTARAAGLVACTRCTRVWPAGQETCERCGAALSSRAHHGLQRVWAWWTIGLIAYVPANLYPMLVTTMLFNEQKNTIVGGALELAAHGSYGVSIIVLVASVLIPVGKFFAIALLSLGVKRRSQLSHHRRQQLYEVVEFIGRWSMVDVFVVAILSALVQLSAVASIHPGPASISFALSVIFTMLSAQNFDPRLIWDADSAEDADALPAKDLPA